MFIKNEDTRKQYEWLNTSQISTISSYRDLSQANKLQFEINTKPFKSEIYKNELENALEIAKSQILLQSNMIKTLKNNIMKTRSTQSMEIFENSPKMGGTMTNFKVSPDSMHKSENNFYKRRYSADYEKSNSGNINFFSEFKNFNTNSMQTESSPKSQKSVILQTNQKNFTKNSETQTENKFPLKTLENSLLVQKQKVTQFVQEITRKIQEKFGKIANLIKFIGIAKIIQKKIIKLAKSETAQKIKFQKENEKLRSQILLKNTEFRQNYIKLAEKFSKIFENSFIFKELITKITNLEDKIENIRNASKTLVKTTELVITKKDNKYKEIIGNLKIEISFLKTELAITKVKLNKKLEEKNIQANIQNLKIQSNIGNYDLLIKPKQKEILKNQILSLKMQNEKMFNKITDLTKENQTKIEYIKSCLEVLKYQKYELDCEKINFPIKYREKIQSNLSFSNNKISYENISKKLPMHNDLIISNKIGDLSIKNENKFTKINISTQFGIMLINYGKIIKKVNESLKIYNEKIQLFDKNIKEKLQIYYQNLFRAKNQNLIINSCENISIKSTINYEKLRNLKSKIDSKNLLKVTGFYQKFNEIYTKSIQKTKFLENNINLLKNSIKNKHNLEIIRFEPIIIFPQKLTKFSESSCQTINNKNNFSNILENKHFKINLSQKLLFNEQFKILNEKYQKFANFSLKKIISANSKIQSLKQNLLKYKKVSSQNRFTHKKYLLNIQSKLSFIQGSISIFNGSPYLALIAHNKIHKKSILFKFNSLSQNYLQFKDILNSTLQHICTKINIVSQKFIQAKIKSYEKQYTNNENYKIINVKLSKIREKYQEISYSVSNLIKFDNLKYTILSRAFQKTLENSLNLVTDPKILYQIFNETAQNLSEIPDISLVKSEISREANKILYKCSIFIGQIEDKAEKMAIRISQIYTNSLKIFEEKEQKHNEEIQKFKQVFMQTLIKFIEKSMKSCENLTIKIDEINKKIQNLEKININLMGKFKSINSLYHDAATRIMSQENLLLKHQQLILHLNTEKSLLIQENSLLTKSASNKINTICEKTVAVGYSPKLLKSPISPSEFEFSNQDFSLLNTSKTKSQDDVKLKLGNTIMALEDIKKEKDYYKNKVQKYEKHLKEQLEVNKSIQQKLKQIKSEESIKENAIMKLTQSFENIRANIQELKDNLINAGDITPETGQIIKNIIESFENNGKL